MIFEYEKAQTALRQSTGYITDKTQEGRAASEASSKKEKKPMKHKYSQDEFRL